ncbi:unnamed protein product [Pleuronectes platessa]|uniref:Uncharacterized protein n=1 Tax=Pleuronectes platessa TaxID=8262 RepID=A0A9N7TT45_PLEPL|nr:unnamed protein product [Pleuronectes platessa]
MTDTVYKEEWDRRATFSSSHRDSDTATPETPKVFCGLKNFTRPIDIGVEQRQTVQCFLAIPETGGDKEPALSDTDEGSAYTGAAARLAKLARSYLCITGTSVPSERVFWRLD